jgi:hypothetical protein
LQPYIRTFGAALPLSLMEMRWLAPQSLSRTRSAADVLGFANHGLTWRAINA